MLLEILLASSDGVREYNCKFREAGFGSVSVLDDFCAKWIPESDMESVWLYRAFFAKQMILDSKFYSFAYDDLLNSEFPFLNGLKLDRIILYGSADSIIESNAPYKLELDLVKRFYLQQYYSDDETSCDFIRCFGEKNQEAWIVSKKNHLLSVRNVASCFYGNNAFLEGRMVSWLASQIDSIPGLDVVELKDSVVVDFNFFCLRIVPRCNYRVDDGFGTVRFDFFDAAEGGGEVRLSFLFPNVIDSHCLFSSPDDFGYNLLVWVFGIKIVLSDIAKRLSMAR